MVFIYLLVTWLKPTTSRCNSEHFPLTHDLKVVYDIAPPICGWDNSFIQIVGVGNLRRKRMLCCFEKISGTMVIIGRCLIVNISEKACSIPSWKWQCSIRNVPMACLIASWNHSPFENNVWIIKLVAWKRITLLHEEG